MTHFPRKWWILFLCLGGVVAASMIYQRTQRTRLIHEFLSAEPIKPFVDPSTSRSPWLWESKFLLNDNLSASLRASTIQTIAQTLQYSDEKEFRIIPGNRFIDYTMQEIRFDQQSHILFLRTSDNIWGGYKNPNSFIFKYDIIKRRTIAQYELSPELLPPVIGP